MNEVWWTLGRPAPGGELPIQIVRLPQARKQPSLQESEQTPTSARHPPDRDAKYAESFTVSRLVRLEVAAGVLRLVLSDLVREGTAG